MYSSIDLANAFLATGPFTHMQLQRLVYCAQGWSLACRNKPLVRDNLEVWAFGPVYSELYHYLKRFHRANILSPVVDGVNNNTSCINDKNVHNTVHWIIENYGSMGLDAFHTMVTKSDSPWRRVAERHDYRVRVGTVISNQMLREQFCKLNRSITPLV